MLRARWPDKMRGQWKVSGLTPLRACDMRATMPSPKARETLCALFIPRTYFPKIPTNLSPKILLAYSLSANCLAAT